MAVRSHAQQRRGRHAETGEGHEKRSRPRSRLGRRADSDRGARGRGVDINPVRVEEAQANAKAANVVDRVTFVQGDVFHVPISDATVVTLYLFQHVMNKLMPRLRKELKPGTRVVSHRFTLGDWEPKTTESVGGIPIHLWIVD